MKNRIIVIFMVVVIICTEEMGTEVPVFASDKWAC